MPDRPVELEGFAVVVMGAFNPAIFHPSWFSMNNLIRREEADEAKIEIITPDASIFAADWFALQVIQQKLVLFSSDPTKQAPLRDMAIGILQVLEHTPVEALASTGIDISGWRVRRVGTQSATISLPRPPGTASSVIPG